MLNLVNFDYKYKDDKWATVYGKVEQMVENLNEKVIKEGIKN